MSNPVLLFRPGSVPYETAWQEQRDLAAAIREGRAPEALVLLQHPPVFTLGRRARREHLLADPDYLRGLGADVVEVDRGGDVTFHGPGQVVGYPILNLRSRGLGPADYVRRLEALAIDVLARFGIAGERVPGRPGVWAAGGKICSIGVRVQGGVSTHGFALNVDPDLGWFRAIVPCGLPDVVMTSLGRILGRAPALASVEDAVADRFAAAFDASFVFPAEREGIAAHG